VPIRGEVKVIIPFTNPTIVGRFVYHCHILSHEDKGMMATIQVDP
jgi:FtsP/CotA-like multicopper oxidase with cupredoxin domain